VIGVDGHASPRPYGVRWVAWAVSGSGLRRDWVEASWPLASRAMVWWYPSVLFPERAHTVTSPTRPGAYAGVFSWDQRARNCGALNGSCAASGAEEATNKRGTDREKFIGRGARGVRLPRRHALRACGRAEARRDGSRSSRCSRSPGVKCPGPEDAERVTGCEVTLGVEGVVDGGMNRQKALR
jgi:hypothetical protein